MSEKLGLGSRHIRSAVSLLIALLLIGSISYLGVHTYRSSHASSGPSIYATPSSASVTAGATLSVTLRSNSGSTGVNSVQASLNYDVDKLQYVGITEGGTFPVVAATSTGTPGVIRVGRANADREVTGDNAIVTVNFKVIGTGTGTISVDKSYSFLVNSTTNKDILENVGSGSYTVTAPTVATDPNPNPPATSATPPPAVASPAAGTKPILTLSPPSGSVAPGASLSVGVRLNAYSGGVTTVQAVVNYPAGQLEYTGATEGGVFTTKQRTKTGSGSIDIIRGVTGGSSGINDDNPIVTLKFKVIGSSGSVPLTLGAASGAFDASGSGQNVLDKASSKGATFTIEAGGSSLLVPPGGDTAANNKPPNESFFITPTQALRIGFSGRNGQAAMTTDDKGAALTELGGEVELKPILDPAIFANNPNESLSKVEYYLDGKLIATAKSAPYSYKFDTRTMRNGVYTVGVKSFYSSGVVDTRTDKLKVNNNVTLAYVMRHYAVSTAAVLALLAVLVFVVLRLIVPRFSRKPDPSQPIDHDAMYGFSSLAGRRGSEGPVAGDPLVVAPAGDAASNSASLLPQFSTAAQTTEALPGTQLDYRDAVSPPAAAIAPLQGNRPVSSGPSAPTPDVIRPTSQGPTAPSPIVFAPTPRPDVTPPAPATPVTASPLPQPTVTLPQTAQPSVAAPRQYASMVTMSPVRPTPAPGPSPSAT